MNTIFDELAEENTVSYADVLSFLAEVGHPEVVPTRDDHTLLEELERLALVTGDGATAHLQATADDQRLPTWFRFAVALLANDAERVAQYPQPGTTSALADRLRKFHGARTRVPEARFHVAGLKMPEVCELIDAGAVFADTPLVLGSRSMEDIRFTKYVYRAINVDVVDVDLATLRKATLAVSAEFGFLTLLEALRQRPTDRDDILRLILKRSLKSPWTVSLDATQYLCTFVRKNRLGLNSTEFEHLKDSFDEDERGGAWDWSHSPEVSVAAGFLLNGEPSSNIVASVCAALTTGSHFFPLQQATLANLANSLGLKPFGENEPSMMRHDLLKALLAAGGNGVFADPLRGLMKPYGLCERVSDDLWKELESALGSSAWLLPLYQVQTIARYPLNEGKNLPQRLQNSLVRTVLDGRITATVTPVDELLLMDIVQTSDVATVAEFNGLAIKAVAQLSADGAVALPSGAQLSEDIQDSLVSEFSRSRHPQDSLTAARSRKASSWLTGLTARHWAMLLASRSVHPAVKATLIEMLAKVGPKTKAAILATLAAPHGSALRPRKGELLANMVKRLNRFEVRNSG